MTSSTSIESMQNPSIVLYGAKNAKLEDKPITEPLDPHHVLVRIAYVGVCGSDVSPSFYIALRSFSLNPSYAEPLFTSSGPLLAPRRYRKIHQPAHRAHHGPRSLRHHPLHRHLCNLMLSR
jgi:hypothetical protein